MQEYIFQIEEVNRNGYIAWDAVVEGMSERFPVNAEGHLIAGNFPEVTEYLKEQKGIDFDVSYDETHEDSLRDMVWSYRRGNVRVIVKDIARTVIRLTWQQA